MDEDKSVNQGASFRTFLYSYRQSLFLSLRCSRSSVQSDSANALNCRNVSSVAFINSISVTCMRVEACSWNILSFYLINSCHKGQSNPTFFKSTSSVASCDIQICAVDQ